MTTPRRNNHFVYWVGGLSLFLGLLATLWWFNPWQKERHILRFTEEIPGLGKSVEIELIELKPPVVAWGDQILPPHTAEEVPWWVLSKFWALDVSQNNKFHRFTKSAIEEQDLFGGVQFGLVAPEAYSKITHVFRIKANRIEYYFIGSSFGKELAVLPEWGPLIATRSNEEGDWKIAAPPEWSKYFFFSSEENMKSLLKAGKGKLGELNYLVPAE